MASMSDFVRKMHSEPVTIEVGQGEAAKTYKIPKELLCEQSTWFEKALQEGRFKEGTTNTISLPEDSPIAFDAFFHFVYFGDLSFTSSKGPDVRSRDILDCLELWTFGDKYMLPDFQNCAMMKLGGLFNDDSYDDLIQAHTLTECFKAFTEGSPIRALVAEYVVDKVASMGSEFEIQDELGGCKGFLASVHEAEKTLRDVGPDDFPRCKKLRKYQYHFSALDGGLGASTYIQKFDGRWADQNLWYICDECGYEEEDHASSRCRHCNQENCYCDEMDMRLICTSCK